MYAVLFCVTPAMPCPLLPQEMEDKVISPEKAEEAKFKARYPHLGGKPGGSELLRKRLQKGVVSSNLTISTIGAYACMFTCVSPLSAREPLLSV